MYSASDSVILGNLRTPAAATDAARAGATGAPEDGSSAAEQRRPLCARRPHDLQTGSPAGMTSRTTDEGSNENKAGKNLSKESLPTRLKQMVRVKSVGGSQTTR